MVQEMKVILVLVVVLAITLVVAVGLVGFMNPSLAKAVEVVEENGYIVVPASFASDITAIKAKTDNLPFSPANEVTASAAVVNANNAVVAAENAAQKVDLFNSAEVYVFPSVTNVTMTLTSGTANSFGNWAEIVDSQGITLSSKFATKAGYLENMHLYDHSGADKLYLLEIAYGGSKTILGRIMFHTLNINTCPLKSKRIPMGETLYYRMMSDGLDGATAKVCFRYFYE